MLQPSRPITSCAEDGGFHDGAGGHFYGQSIISHLCIYKEILNNFLGSKVILGSYICMK